MIKEFVEIRKAIFIALEKLRYKERRLKSQSRNIKRYKRRIAQAANEYFKLMTKEIRRGLPKIKGKKSSEIVRSMTDWIALKEEGRKIFNKPLADLVVMGADKITRMRVQKQERTDPIGVSATDWANAHAASLVTGITNETMQALRDIVSNGIDAGLSHQKIASAIRPLAGLNSRQAAAVGNMLAKLEEQGLGAAEIEKKISRYVTKSHRYRSLMISRTETATALNEGTLTGYGDMGIKKVNRVEDPEACDFCLDVVAGNPYTLDEARAIDFHPNEEGVWVAA